MVFKETVKEELVFTPIKFVVYTIIIFIAGVIAGHQGMIREIGGWLLK